MHNLSGLLMGRMTQIKGVMMNSKFKSLSLVAVLLFLFVMDLHAASSAQRPMISVETWRIKPGGKQKYDFWIDGLVKNTSAQRLADVILVFSVETSKGKILGETRAVEEGFCTRHQVWLRQQRAVGPLPGRCAKICLPVFCK